MIYDHKAYLAKMKEDQREREQFSEAYHNSPSGLFHQQQRTTAAAQSASRLNGSEVKRLADEMQSATPGIRMDVAYAAAARKLGLLK